MTVHNFMFIVNNNKSSFLNKVMTILQICTPLISEMYLINFNTAHQKVGMFSLI